MSLEQEIQNLILAIQANTAALQGYQKVVSIEIPPARQFKNGEVIEPAPSKPKAEKAKAVNKTPEPTEEMLLETADINEATDEEAFIQAPIPEPEQELEEEKAEPLTLDDVRPLLLKIANHKALGNTQAFTLLKRHGAAKLTELKAENFEAIRDDAVLMLKKAGVAVK